MPTQFQSVDEYIASQPEPMQAALELVRRAIRRVAPSAEEVIAYQMPTYRLDGKSVFSIAGWRRHYSLYAATAKVVAAFKDELVPYEIQRGTIRFPVSKPVPVDLIERIVEFRVKEIADTLDQASSP